MQSLQKSVSFGSIDRDEKLFLRVSKIESTRSDRIRLEAAGPAHVRESKCDNGVVSDSRAILFQCERAANQQPVLLFFLAVSRFTRVDDAFMSLRFKVNIELTCGKCE